MRIDAAFLASALKFGRILWELIRYDALFACKGMRGVYPAEAGRMLSPEAGNPKVEFEIREGVAAVAPFYWKPIRCLQRSIVIARLMRNHGIPAEVVIGYRAAPFFSHAWVEVGGRVVSDSSVYQQRLRVLERG